MNQRMITPQEIAEHHQSVRIGYQRTQRAFSISGIRRLMGNTFIAMGQKMYGTCEQRREAAAVSASLAPARGV